MSTAHYLINTTVWSHFLRGTDRYEFEIFPHKNINTKFQFMRTILNNAIQTEFKKGPRIVQFQSW
jgi:hypothetical protein